MAISKPAVGATGWNTATDAVIDAVNGLSTVATSGSYSDLVDKPTIPSTPGDVGAQAADSDLTALAGLDSATSGAIASDGAGWIKKTYAQLKTALGLVKADVGLGSVDNTADTAKPVSTAQQAALDAKAPTSRTLIAGTGLTGGGDLTVDRSFAVAYGTTATTAAVGNDARLSDTRTPTDASVTDAKVSASAAIAESKLSLASDAVAATASRRTLGTGSQQAAAGNDSRFSDTRTPTDGSVTDAKVSATAAIAESKLSLASDAAAGTASRRTLGTGAQQATAGNDARLSDARTPTAGSVVDASVSASAAIAESKLALASDAAAGTASRRSLGSSATQAASGNHTHSGYATSTDLAGYVPTSQRAPIGGVSTISYTATITPNAAVASEQRVVATGNLTVNTPINGVDGQYLLLWVQASGGARAVTMASGYENTQPVPGDVYTIPSGTWGSVLARNRNGTWVLMAATPQPSVTPVTVTWAATTTIDASLGKEFRVTLAGNTTLAVPTNLVDGQTLLVEVVQDAAAARTLTLASGWNVATAVTGAVTISSTLGTRSYIGARYRSSGAKLDVLAFGTGFAA